MWRTGQDQDQVLGKVPVHKAVALNCSSADLIVISTQFSFEPSHSFLTLILCRVLQLMCVWPCTFVTLGMIGHQGEALTEGRHA